ncbi:bile acid:sodium symporter [Rhabdobacter roseus]|uniref:Sodium/bile acid cotransporter 7 n=1 Tax=Rhabdobacter roseus TaxID=1655419 RepID=A0A840TSN7_9BACT|nr:bile acid:sodium symporter family protein [Rhabdobacter roseus]MBB5284283.1 sodium/bile acid cotransporter 7 [Rhabdobacter roseus]
MKNTFLGVSQRVLSVAAKAGLDGFLLALLGMIGLAYLWPYPGTEQSPVPLADIATYGVSLIFFFYGLRLSPEKLRAGLSNWRLHTLVHLATFVLFPVLVLLIRPFFRGADNEVLWLGIFFLAALPSTVSSSVVMVSMAGGNIPAAIFNASISSLLGVFITPVWMGLVLDKSSTSFELGPVIIKLTIQVLVPVFLGILLHRRWGTWAERHKHTLRAFDQTTILLIIYTSFCESFDEGLFASFSWGHLGTLAVGMVVLFYLIYGLMILGSRWLGFRREDRITAVFCGSKKSMVQGAVMAKVLFGGSAEAGIILLPIMLYHALQLIMASMLAQRMARETARRLASESTR